MTAAAFRIEPLGEMHDRAAFQCGEEALDRYFQTQATQDIRRRVANCFVAVEIVTGQIAAFYTLSAASIPLVDLPPEEARRLPRYPTLPAVRIGRLAVDKRFHGSGSLDERRGPNRPVRCRSIYASGRFQERSGSCILSALWIPRSCHASPDVVSSPGHRSKNPLRESRPLKRHVDFAIP
jgi:hypothetical protein